MGEMEDQMNQNWGMFSNRASKQQSGSALIEVIAALVILALVSLPLIKLLLMTASLFHMPNMILGL